MVKISVCLLFAPSVIPFMNTRNVLLFLKEESNQNAVNILWRGRMSSIPESYFGDIYDGRGIQKDRPTGLVRYVWERF